MLRKETKEDISEEVFNKIIKPFIDNYDEYIESYDMPEIIAYYIANGYYRNYLSNCSFIQHYNSTKNMLNFVSEDYEKVISEIFKLLRIKYSLIILNENP